jgi:uncharacterized Zn finger protein (UPF0148 family)
MAKINVCDECGLPWTRLAGETNLCPKCFWLIKDSGKPKKTKLVINRPLESSDAPLRADLQDAANKSIRNPDRLSEGDLAAAPDA